MPVPNLITDLDTAAANNSPPGTESAKGNIDNYFRAAFAFIAQLRDGRLATDANISAPRTLGLIGYVNTTTPLTKFDLAADAVVLRNAAGGVIARYNTGTLTCDLGLTGPAANGRDQSSAFTANSFVHLYFIWNGTTLATLASVTAPASFTGSTLPSGYTHWAYATTIRWNASSNIIRCVVRGSLVSYAAAQSLLSGGTAVVETGLSLAALVPTIAATYGLKARLGTTATGSPVGVSLGIRPISSYDMFTLDTYAAAGASNMNTAAFTAPNTGTLYYAGGGGVFTADFLIHSYTVPNGDC
jgi:hypothetical protein